MGMQDNTSELQTLHRVIGNQAIASWRFAKAFSRLAAAADADQQLRYESQLRWFNRTVRENLIAAEMNLVDHEGQTYDTGMAVQAVNADEFAGGDHLVVDQMLEPIIVWNGNVIHTGIVTVKKAT